LRDRPELRGPKGPHYDSRGHGGPKGPHYDSRSHGGPKGPHYDSRGHGGPKGPHYACHAGIQTVVVQAFRPASII